MNTFLSEWKNNKDYFQLLELMARLSNLFSDNTIPYLNYRVTENLFCKYFNAENLSRTDTAFDAKKESFGVGIKTFQLNNDSSVEKVAEFNAISKFLNQYKGADLAYQVAKARNDRMELGMRLYAIDSGCYHIIGRVQKGLTVFNSEYPLINISKIHSVVDTGKTLRFEDDKDFYSFNYSKSTLFKRFVVPSDRKEISVSIIQDPYEILRKLIDMEDYNGKDSDVSKLHEVIKNKFVIPQVSLKKGENYVVLPLFSEKFNNVPEKSGLNQWNASGRDRNPDEVYIPIPKALHDSYPTFFPEREVPFDLRLPNGETISAKVCQSDRKALMSNPNCALGKWILREGELLTLDLLDRMGFNSVSVFKDDETHYRIDVCMLPYEGY